MSIITFSLKCWGAYMWAHVATDITKPLLYGKMIQLSNIEDKICIDLITKVCLTFAFIVKHLESPTPTCGLWLWGHLPWNRGLHCYHTEFNHGGAWPFITWLVQNSLGPSLTWQHTVATLHPINHIATENSVG